ncbi:Protein kinase protein with adenine nucleotide alpha hydrolases-like domain [Raphanus sativus]|uniref:U-box domain-containing protein 35 n=1 Tax=Raphanus sativus TaxID=3726 RepID=A0A6J0KTH8_RAPSA|nr:U-box domain-containing protein 35 [Raphanus sativus]KAJ4879419.1 Protein kinase protein with adenine nucleotide alpha hydrolases-like domain [Raphanus sativus]
MAGRRVIKGKDSNGVTVIAIDKDKNSQHALKWALEHLIVDSSNCILLHVQTKLRIGEGGENTEAPHDNQEEAQKFFLPFRGFCARKGIRAKEVLLHDIDIASAIVDYINNNSISNIVIGASARNTFLKKFKSVDMPATLLKTTPDTCSVFVVTKEKLLTSRPASRPHTPQHNPQPSKQQQPFMSMSSDPGPASFVSTASGRSSSASNGDFSRPATTQYKPSHNMSSPGEFSNEFSSNRHSVESNGSFYSILGRSTDGGSSHSSTSMVSSILTGESLSGGSITEQENQNLELEVRRLRLELQQFNATMARETAPAAESEKLEEAKVAREMLKELSEMDKQKTQSALQAAEMAQRLEEIEKQKRRLVEMQARFNEQSMANNVSYRRYSIKDVEDATDGFSDALKIGEGGYGPVFKAVIENTSVAIKILKSDVSQGLKQFQQEVEVLSCMRHPNMVILLGACPEYGCLVYEYMENGTLEDRLFCRDNTPPLSWRARFRIAAEIATGLLFLHQAKPEPLVHRDLKPANILLDRHLNSKISDVGLARLVPPAVADSFTHYHMTAAAGTFCYIDPEYQQTGMLGVKSDLYSFGVVLLQILTAMPAMGLSHRVEQGIEKNRLREVLDPRVSDWPEEETLVLAQLALQCCELRKKDRPDLATVLLPALSKLREFATEDHGSDRTFSVSRAHNSVPRSPISSSPVGFLEPAVTDY